MNVSIIIPTKNRASILEETVSNIYDKQKYPLNSFEVIIVNDGDNLPENLTQRYPNLIIIKNKGKGAASARNTGAQAAKNELLLFIDDDILIGETCIEKHIALHAQYPRSLISGSRQYNPDILPIFKNIPFGRYLLMHDYKTKENDYQVQNAGTNKKTDNIYSPASLASFNLSILTKDFKEIGGFNESFPFAGCEDQELTLKVKGMGFQLLFDTSNLNLDNDKHVIVMKKWLARQYTGVQGFVLLCELFPFRKEERLYYENTPVNKSDSFNLKVKKTIKQLLSGNIPLSVLVNLTFLLENLKVKDSTLFSLYNMLCGLYLNKGFRHAYKTLKN